MADQRTENRYDLLHGSQFVVDDYAHRARVAFGHTTFDVSWDNACEELNNPRDSFVFCENPNVRVHSDDAYDAHYSNGFRVFYPSSLASLYYGLWSFAQYIMHDQL